MILKQFELISVFLPRRTRETFRRLFQVKYGNGFIYFSKPENNFIQYSTVKMD